MQPTLEHLNADAPTGEIVSRLDSDGAVILDHFLDADLLARFNAESRVPLIRSWSLGRGTRHLDDRGAREDALPR